MTYTVNYLATDGEIRHMEVEAETSEDAVSAAFDKDAETNSCGDNILKIISVD